MKKHLLIATLLLFVSGISFAQPLSGIKNVGSGGDYPTIEAAIAALNANGVVAPGVTFDVAAGYTETFSTFAAGQITTLTGSATSPIVFEKSGLGVNPLITAAATNVGLLDAIITIAGCDYVTFDGIDLKENGSNSNAEWGYAILKAGVADGSQNITIKNCSITLNKSNTASVGIYSNNHLTSSTTALAVNNVSGANSNLKIFNNTISNCYSGISITGFNDVVGNSFAFYDQNNEIGKDGGNTILTFGGSTVTDYGIYTKYQNNLKIGNNTINATVDGNGACSGIQLDASSNATLELYSNTVKVVYNGTGTFNGIYDNMGTTVTNNTINIHDNIVTQCAMPKATSGTCNYFNVQHSGISLSFHGNSVTNNVYGSTTAGTTGIGTVYGFYFFGNAGVLGTIDVYENNMSSNSRAQSTLGGGATTLYNLALKGSVMNVYNNIATNYTTTTNGSVVGYSVASASPTRNFYGNTLTRIYGSYGLVFGVQGSGSGISTTSVYGNKIDDINSNLLLHATYPVVSGIVFAPTSTGITPVYVYNNMISGLKAPLCTSDKGVSGIVISQSNVTTYYGIYDNTVYLDGTGAAGFGSSALYANITSTTAFPIIDLRGNLFVNNCTPSGAGFVAALRTTAIGTSCFSNLSNNNNYFAGSPSATHLIYYDVTNSDQTLAAFKARFAPGEVVSVTENSPFMNVSASPYNLHLNAAIATQCESAGQVISSPAITTDIDGNNRYPNAGYPTGAFTPNNPDIGADEIGGLSVDLTQPVIQFTPLANAPNGSARQLTATIQDVTGVPVAGAGLPVLYWKINSGTWHAAQGVHGTGSNYIFTFGAGSIFNDVVSYYIVAQDLVAPIPNVGANPFIGAGLTYTPPASATPPTTPYTYLNLGAISGTFHVGVGKAYATINAAVSDLNLKTRTGPVTFLLDDATYPSETFPISITSSMGASAVNTVTIRPNTAMNVVITGENTQNIGSEAEGIIQFKGAQYIVIDGSNTGSSAKSFAYTQNLTIENTANAGNSATVALINNGSVPATHITIKNCVIQAVTTPDFATTALSFYNNNGGFNDVLINNNIIRQAKLGIAMFGSELNPNMNVKVTNNLIGSDDDSKGITWRGITASYFNNLLVEGNEVIGIQTGTVLDYTNGLGFDNCSNTKIRKNKIHDWVVNGIGYCNGLAFHDATSSADEITNNLIYNIRAAGQNLSPNQACAKGILIDRCQNLLLAYNTVYLNGAVLGDGDINAWPAGSTSTCVHFSGNATGVDFRNNILNNSMTRDPLAVSILITTYAVSCGAPLNPFTGGYSDNNDYFGNGYNPHVGYGSATELKTLTDWKTYSLKDASSIVADPLLTSTSNLLPLTGSPVIGAAAPLTSVSDDYLGISRDAVYPTIGGYELTFIPPTRTLNLTSIFLEGLYTGSGTMHQAQDASGPHFTAPTADQITVELHSSVSGNYSNIIWSSGLVNLSTSGTATVTVPGDKSGSYYITIRHRNSIETVTATAVSFAGNTISYAFDAPSKAFGSNMGTPLPADGHYLIYAGDVNQDNSIDSGDFTPVDNDASNYAAGYLATDINGDGSIDSGDFTSIDNNGLNYIGSSHP